MTPRMPDYSKIAAGYTGVLSSHLPRCCVPVSYIATTDKSVVSVTNLNDSRLNQGEFAVPEPESDVIQSDVDARSYSSTAAGYYAGNGPHDE